MCFNILHHAFDPEVLIYFESVTTASSGINVLLCCAVQGMDWTSMLLPRRMGNLGEWAGWSHRGHRLTPAPSWEPWCPSRKAGAGQGLGFLLHLSVECVSHSMSLLETSHGGEWASFLPSGPFSKAFMYRGLYMFLYTFKLCLLCVFFYFWFLSSFHQPFKYLVSL